MHLGDPAQYDTRAWFIHACKEVSGNYVVVVYVWGGLGEGATLQLA